MHKQLTIYTDGGARGNPGPAAIGIVITYKTLSEGTLKEETIKQGKYIGHATNNVAEYSALLEAFHIIKEEKNAEISCFLDSELVVKQLNGQYKVKDENLKKLWALLKAAEKHFAKVTYAHVPRNQNKIADKIVNEVLDSQ